MLVNGSEAKATASRRSVQIVWMSREMWSVHFMVMPKCHTVMQLHSHL